MPPTPDSTPEPSQTKRCPQCGEVKPITEYGTALRNGKYPRSYCRACMKEKNRAYYAANKQRLSQLRSEKYAQNPTPLKSAVHRWRARRFGSDGTYTTEDMQRVHERQIDSAGRLICPYCGDPIIGEYYVDHWIPLSRGGTNTADNLRLLHPSCNQKKANKLPPTS